MEAPITPRRVLTFKPSLFLVARLNCETVAGREAERECSKDFRAYAESLA